ncbi:MAG: M3 family metallopeptidase [Pseudomonadota bacterium]
MTNPLLSDWNTPYGLPPFALISDEDFAPGLDEALALARREFEAIRDNADAPSFANTIEALELMGGALDKVLSSFSAVTGTDSNDRREELQREFAPKLSAFSSEISMDPKLFARIDTLWMERENLELTDEQQRVLMLRHRAFVRSGARLTGSSADRLKEIKTRLAVLGTQFTQNLLADERSWFMALSENDLAGLPDFVRDAARAAGQEKGVDGPAVTLSRSLIVPFLQFSSRRDLRQKAFEAWASRGAGGGDTDNRGIAAETLKLREERARLLGFETFADFKLSTEMAKTPGAVEALLMSVWTPAKSAADRDGRVLEGMLHEDGIDGPLLPWDWRYYAEKRRAAEHDLNEEELKPYFQLDAMLQAAFDCSNRLFGLEFEELDVDLYKDDVRAWDVTRNGEHIAVFIGDYFHRSGKRSGAWCSAWRSQQKLKGNIRPLVHNVCNFARPAEGSKALLSYDDARTLFHEFGHALHQMLSDVTYESISGTSVARDFVELPSQLFEHWLEVPEVLAKHALHAQTGEAIPADLLARLLAAQTYDMGFATVEYTASALVDLAFHNGPAPADPMQKQAEVLESIGMPGAIVMRHATPQFAHVFAGDGYSCGYYSYMWSEVMDADAFEAFGEAGGAFDEETAKKLETHILSAGGSDEADVLYKRFRGRMPGVDALLRGRGLSA